MKTVVYLYDFESDLEVRESLDAVIRYLKQRPYEEVREHVSFLECLHDHTETARVVQEGKPPYTLCELRYVGCREEA